MGPKSPEAEVKTNISTINSPKAKIDASSSANKNGSYKKKKKKKKHKAISQADVSGLFVVPCTALCTLAPLVARLIRHTNRLSTKSLFAGTLGGAQIIRRLHRGSVRAQR